MTREYQLIYQSTCWEDVQRALNNGANSAPYLELSWNILKQLPQRDLIPASFLDQMSSKTTSIVVDMDERCYASVWHALGRLQHVNRIRVCRNSCRASVRDI